MKVYRERLIPILVRHERTFSQFGLFDTLSICPFKCVSVINIGHSFDLLTELNDLVLLNVK